MGEGSSSSYKVIFALVDVISRVCIIMFIFSTRVVLWPAMVSVGPKWFTGMRSDWKRSIYPSCVVLSWVSTKVLACQNCIRSYCTFPIQSINVQEVRNYVCLSALVGNVYEARESSPRRQRRDQDRRFRVVQVHEGRGRVGPFRCISQPRVCVLPWCN